MYVCVCIKKIDLRYN